MIIGTCSICGGPVKASADGSPSCSQCGARGKGPYGPVIPMEAEPFIQPPTYDLPPPSPLLETPGE